MKKEIIINASSSDIRVAITEDARLAELFLELPDKERHVGSIYLGRVERVVQGMNAAFVDIGLEQHAFLHFSDAAKAGEDFSDLLTDDDDDEAEEGDRKKKTKPQGGRDRGRRETRGGRGEKGKRGEEKQGRKKEAEKEPTAEKTGTKDQRDEREKGKRQEKESGRRDRDRSGRPKGDEKRADKGETGQQETEERKDRDGRRDERRQRPESREKKEPQQRKDQAAAQGEKEEEGGETSQKKSGSRRRRPKRRKGGREGEPRESSGAETTPSDEKREGEGRERREPAPEPADTQQKANRAEGQQQGTSSSSSKRRRPKSRQSSGERPPRPADKTASEVTEGQKPTEDRRKEDETTGEEKKEQARRPNRRRPNRRSSGEREKSANRETPPTEKGSSDSPDTSTPRREESRKKEQEGEKSSAEEKGQTEGSRKKSSSRRRPKRSGKPEEQSGGEDTRAQEPREKPSASSEEKGKTQTEEKPAPARSTRKGRGKKSGKKPEGDQGSGNADSGTESEEKKTPEAKPESGKKSASEGTESPSGSGSSRRRGGKRPARKSGDGGDQERKPRTMDAQLPTFQTKRFGEITISLERGQELLTQVTRESYASKGVKVSTKISLPGRFLVLMPLDPAVGISRKVQDPKERRRLRGIARKMLPEGFGCIIRTVAQDKDSEMLEQELRMLLDRWKEIDEKLKNAKAPLLLYKDQSVANTVMRDLFTPDVSRVVIDNKSLYQETCDYVSWAAPALLNKIEHYNGRTPIFQQFGVEKELDKMLGSKVWLSTGGYLILEQTEAMMVIDVNSGRYAKEKEQELNALKINLESAREIARQIRLRDIGGLIVIDFIDLYDEKNRKKVYDELKKELSRDRAKSVVLPMTQFGIIQMTRQRVRQQLVQTMSEPCPTCKGNGIVQSKSTILRRIERWLGAFRAETREFRLTLTANPHVIEFMTEGDAMSRLTKLMLKYFVRIKVVPDDSLDMEDFRFFSIRRQADVTQEYMEK